tara:strand:+ start:169 stop:345 length:177 start_codon:yes stop_codon:yes gene_type:complete
MSTKKLLTCASPWFTLEIIDKRTQTSIQQRRSYMTAITKEAALAKLDKLLQGKSPKKS